MYHSSAVPGKSLHSRDRRPQAVLLLGPTGSGKSPLGEAAARSGLWRRRAVHFDFGERLRRAAAPGSRERVGLTRTDLAVVHRSLSTGALLEDKDFPIAAKIFRTGLRTARVRTGDLVILNGLPRHTGQARGMDRLVEIIAVIILEAAAAVVRERIRRDTGGDRRGRTDDSLAEIEAKLAVYRRRTRPLVEHYRRTGAAVITVDVGARTTAATMLRRLERAGRIALATFRP